MENPRQAVFFVFRRQGERGDFGPPGNPGVPGSLGLDVSFPRKRSTFLPFGPLF